MDETQKVTVLVDVANLYCRAKYAHVGGLTTSDGRQSGQLYGFIRSMETIKTRFPVGKMYLAMENGGSAVRQAVLPQYKGDRDYSGEPMFAEGHMDGIEKWAEYSGHDVVYGEQTEADDVIAELCARPNLAPPPLVIVSGDHDFRSLLRLDCAIMRDVNKPLFTALDLANEQQITPDQYKMLMALSGDPSDNIPGVPGIGEVRGRTILRECGFDWAKVLEHPKVAPHREEVEKYLAVIQFLPVDPVHIQSSGDMDKQALINLYTHWEFESLLQGIR